MNALFVRDQKKNEEQHTLRLLRMDDLVEKRERRGMKQGKVEVRNRSTSALR